MSDVTQILQQIESGNQESSRQLLPLVYDELRRLAAARMANERDDHTLQATALVHEAYVRLVDSDKVQGWDSRGHFFTAAAEAMRRILIESARSKNAAKRGGGAVQISIGDPPEDTLTQQRDLLLDLDEKLIQLEQEDPVIAELVKLRLYAGLSILEAGQALGMSRKTVYNNWEYVRSWFAVELL
jgi:RNA polymerase sigma factor (TIGR02999 family)